MADGRTCVPQAVGLGKQPISPWPWLVTAEGMEDGLIKSKVMIEKLDGETTKVVEDLPGVQWVSLLMHSYVCG